MELLVHLFNFTQFYMTLMFFYPALEMIKFCLFAWLKGFAAISG
jgi:hypothetical protein